MPSHSACRVEIESLHDFFVDWFTGQADGEAIQRLEGALAADFEMVTPAGVRREYAAVVDGIEAAHASYDPDAFGIEIRDVEMRYAGEETALVRYEEWQDTPDGETGRVSTVLFEDAPDAPGGVVWLDLQETWLERPDSV